MEWRKLVRRLLEPFYNFEETSDPATGKHSAGVVPKPDPFSKPGNLPPVGGTVDFNSIYQQSGVTAAPFTAEQFLEMLASLPSDLPANSRRQTVLALLNALPKESGSTPDAITRDAQRKISALNTYTDSLIQEADKMVANTQQEISVLQIQIDAKQKLITDTLANKSQMIDLCTTNSKKLQTVLDFFHV